mgnify:CR=1 FL=1
MPQASLPNLVAAHVASPCVSLCQLDGDGVCNGCGRTLDEITRWRVMSTEQKQVCVELASARQAARKPQPQTPG